MSATSLAAEPPQPTIARRPAWTVRTAWAATVAVLATAVLLVVSSSASAVQPGVAGVDWWAASYLPPLTAPTDSPGGSLRRDDVGEIVCRGENLCVSSTTRPELHADIAPDPTTGAYRYQVFDLTGGGGLSQVAAEAQTADATWVPPAGALEHGHVYVWSVIGEPTEQQPYAHFTVDLDRSLHQPIDDVGPFSVGAATGNLSFEVPVGSSEMLSLTYSASGASTTAMVPAGWTLGGPGIEGAMYTHVESFGDGSTVIVHGLDGSELRYERDEDGAYAPPTLGALDVSYLFPTIESVNGVFRLAGTYGGTWTFGSNGDLVRYESAPVDGSLEVDMTFETNGGRIVSVTDQRTGQTMFVSYLGDRDCRPPSGFDRGSADPLICSIIGFDGEITNFGYLDGELAMVETNGATVRIAWDEAGRPVALSDVPGSDVAAATDRADDLALTWRVAYDDRGRVSSIKTPEVPVFDATAEVTTSDRLTRSYTYANGETVVEMTGAGTAREVGRVTYDANDAMTLTSSTNGSNPTVFHYDDVGRAYGSTDPAGLRSTIVVDDDGNLSAAYGPAPDAWFDGREPRPEFAAQVATTTYENGAGAGAFAYFYDSVDPAGEAVARQLLESFTLTAFPGAVDPANGWRMLVIADPVVATGTSHLRVTANGVDQQESGAVLNGVPVELGEEIEFESETEGRVTLAIDLRVPEPAGPVGFTIEMSSDEGQTWTEVSPQDLSGVDLPTAETTYDTYQLGGAAVAVTDTTEYADPALGLAGGTLRNGERVSHLAHEPASPSDDQWARLTSVTSPSGLMTEIEYWGSNEVASVPAFDGRPAGPAVPQQGLQKSVRIDGQPTYTTIHDEFGRPAATLEDGSVVEAVSYDERGRPLEIVVPAGTDPVTSPKRTTEFVYGVDGDPHVTHIVDTIGDEADPDGAELLVTSMRTDSLGRVVESTDVWGVHTTNSYDAVGDPVRETSTGPDGTTTTTDRVFDVNGLRDVFVTAADGQVYAATTVGRDGANRDTQIDYLSGPSTDALETVLSVEREFDANGLPAVQRWRDGDGAVWTDTRTGSPQTGRLLVHDLDGPSASATYDYRYDPTSGALIEAELTIDTGTDVLEPSWTYDYGPPAASCAAHYQLAHLDGARSRSVEVVGARETVSETCYDEYLAPIAQATTTTIGEAAPIVEDVELEVAGGNVVAYDGVALSYDRSGHVSRIVDGDTEIVFRRLAGGNPVEQRITVDGVPQGAARNAAGGLVLASDGTALGQSIALPGVAVSVPLVDGTIEWSVDTLGADRWFVTDADGSPTGAPTFFSPDGAVIPEWQELSGATSTSGWKSGAGAMALSIDSSVVLFGQRAYLTGLAAFSAADPLALGGSTPFNYANGDPINLADPSGEAPVVIIAIIVVGAIMATTGAALMAADITGGDFLLSFGLTLMMIGLMGVGGAGATFAALMVGLGLSGYLAYQSYLAFKDGDWIGGIFYAIDAALTLFFVAAAAKALYKGNYAWKLTAQHKGRTYTQYVTPKKYGMQYHTPTTAGNPPPGNHRYLEAPGKFTVSGGGTAMPGSAGKAFQAMFRGTGAVGQILFNGTGRGFSKVYLVKRFVLGIAYNQTYRSADVLQDWVKGTNPF